MSHIYTQISAFRTARSTEPLLTTLDKFLFSDKNKDRIEQLRAEQDMAKRNEIKKSLPAATISGVFEGGRKIDLCKQYTGLICMDFDGKDNNGLDADDIKSLVCAFDQVFYAGISAGGQGVFAIIPTNLQNAKHHGRICDLLGRAFAKVGINYDPSCKDITRLRFISYDANYYYNPDASTFNAQRFADEWDAEERERINRPPAPMLISITSGRFENTTQKVEAYIALIEQNRAALPSYDDWLKIGFALSTEFGHNGEDYFVRLSDTHQEVARKKYAELHKSNQRRIKIGSFFKICHKNGIRE